MRGRKAKVVNSFVKGGKINNFRSGKMKQTIRTSSKRGRRKY